MMREEEIVSVSNEMRNTDALKGSKLDCENSGYKFIHYP